MSLLGQITGWWRNFLSALVRVKPDDFLPPGLKDLANWIIRGMAYALGLEGTPFQQVVYSIAFAIAFYLSSLSPAIIVTLPIAILFTLTFLWGVIRWTPAANQIWLRIRGPFARAYNRLVEIFWGWDL